MWIRGCPRDEIFLFYHLFDTTTTTCFYYRYHYYYCYYCERSWVYGIFGGCICTFHHVFFLKDEGGQLLLTRLCDVWVRGRACLVAFPPLLTGVVVVPRPGGRWPIRINVTTIFF